MATSDQKIKALADALHAAGHSRYCDKSYASPTRDAQLNLEGRTHYVDEGTMRYFHSRIVYAGDHCHGLIYAIIESVAIDPGNSKRGFRPVLFDIFGTVISHVPLENAYRTSDTARKAMRVTLNTLDVLAHYRQSIDDKRKALAREGMALTACRRVVK